MRFLIYLIPLLPFISYFIYFVNKNRKLKKNEILVGIKNGPWVRLIFISLILLISMVLIGTFTSRAHKGEDYTPARYENGELIPSSKND